MVHPPQTVVMITPILHVRYGGGVVAKGLVLEFVDDGLVFVV